LSRSVRHAELKGLVPGLLSISVERVATVTASYFSRNIPNFPLPELTLGLKLQDDGHAFQKHALAPSKTIPEVY
jgi:hypothetical protein